MQIYMQTEKTYHVHVRAVAHVQCMVKYVCYSDLCGCACPDSPPGPDQTIPAPLRTVCKT